MNTPLYNFKPSPIEIQKESPRARDILLLKAQGLSNRAIAERLGISETAVGYTVRQPWFMQNLITLIHEKGEPAVEKVLNSLQSDAIAVALEVMNTTKDDRVRANCAFEFIKAARGTKIVLEQQKLPPAELIREEQRLTREINILKGLPVEEGEGDESSGTMCKNN